MSFMLQNNKSPLKPLIDGFFYPFSSPPTKREERESIHEDLEAALNGIRMKASLHCAPGM